MNIIEEIKSVIENVFSIANSTTSFIIKKEVEMLHMISESGPFGLLLILTAICLFYFYWTFN
jgi:urea transporter